LREAILLYRSPAESTCSVSTCRQYLFPFTHIKCSMKITRLRRRRKRTASSRLPWSRRTTNRTLSPRRPRHRTRQNRHDEIRAIDQLIKAQIRPPGQRREIHKTNANKKAARAEQKNVRQSNDEKRRIGKINFRDKSGYKNYQVRGIIYVWDVWGKRVETCFRMVALRLDGNMPSQPSPWSQLRGAVLQ